MLPALRSVAPRFEVGTTLENPHLPCPTARRWDAFALLLPLSSSARRAEVFLSCRGGDSGWGKERVACRVEWKSCSWAL